MPRKRPIELKFDRILQEYRQRYNVDTLDSPNDLANLHSMIRNQILIEKLQSQLSAISEQDDIDTQAIKKILDSIVALSEVNVTLERTLGIDRKSRKQESSESVADYIVSLKSRAKEWLDDTGRLTKVVCKSCNIMVGRISGVYDITAYDAWFQCPQCKKKIIARRNERDIFFDVKDADWRRKYPIEIEQAKRATVPTIENVDDDVVLGEE